MGNGSFLVLLYIIELFTMFLPPTISRTRETAALLAAGATKPRNQIFNVCGGAALSRNGCHKNSPPSLEMVNPAMLLIRSIFQLMNMSSLLLSSASP